MSNNDLKKANKKIESSGGGAFRGFKEARQHQTYVNAVKKELEKRNLTARGVRPPKGVKKSIGTVAGEAEYVKTETENKYGRWNDDYQTKDGYWVIHEGKKHHVYKVKKPDFARLPNGKISDKKLSPYGKEQLNLIQGAKLYFTDDVLTVKGNKLVSKDGKVFQKIDNDRLVNKIEYRMLLQ